MTSNVVISITIKDEVVLSLVFTPHPAFQASRTRLLILVRRHESCTASEPMAPTSESTQAFAQLGVCHAAEIIFKVVIALEAHVCGCLGACVGLHIKLVLNLVPQGQLCGINLC